MRAFVVSVDAATADVAADRLWQLGVRAIEERMGDDGRVELWTAVGEDDSSVARAATALDAGWAWRTVDVPDRYPESWREHARPVLVGERLEVAPAWWVDGSGDPARVRVAIEPGAAFGLGDHPTTMLTLAAVEREVDRRTTPAVLDVGCGTGVVSIAAVALGARQARAIDVSSAAAESTADNAARNGVADRVDVDTRPVEDVVGTFDVVAANILAPTLIAMAIDLRRLTARDGALVVSGVLADAHDHVVGALAPMRAARTDTADGWAAVTFVHP